jgi:hypothetical protein
MNSDRSTPAGGALDISPGHATQGHVSQKIVQEFQLLRQRTVECKRLQLQAEEFLYRDQFGNCYTTFRATLPDGELYDKTFFFGFQRSHNGTIVTRAEWKKISPTYNDAVVDAMRDAAFVALGRSVLDILKARQAADAVFVLSADEAAAAADGVVTSIMAAGQAETPENFIDPKPAVDILPDEPLAQSLT